jgi:hypothetical protein
MLGRIIQTIALLGYARPCRMQRKYDARNPRMAAVWRVIKAFVELKLCALNTKILNSRVSFFRAQ